MAFICFLNQLSLFDFYIFSLYLISVFLSLLALFIGSFYLISVFFSLFQLLCRRLHRLCDRAVGLLLREIRIGRDIRKQPVAKRGNVSARNG